MRKKFILFLFFSIVFVSWVLLSPYLWFTAAFEWQLQSLCKKIFGQPLHYESIHWRDGTIHVTEPWLPAESNAQPMFSARDVTFAFALDWKKPSIKMDITSTQPLVHILQTTPIAQCPTNFLDPIQSYASWFSCDWTIKKGAIEIASANKEEAVFHAEYEIDTPNRHAKFFIPNHGDTETQNTLIVSWKDSLTQLLQEKSADAFEVDITCKKMHIDRLQQLLSHVDIPLLSHWRVQNALLDGKITIDGSNTATSSECIGQLSLQQCLVQHMPSSMNLSFPQNTLSFHTKADENLLPPRPLWQKIWHDTSVQIDIAGDGYIHLVDTEKTNWSIQNISGSLQIGAEQIPYFQIKGMLQDTKEMVPVQASGSLDFTKEVQHTSILLSLAPQQRKMSTIELLLDTHEETTEVYADCKNIAWQEMRALQNVVICFFPKAEQFIVEQGQVDLQCFAQIVKNKIQTITLKHLNAQKIEAQYLPLNFAVALEQIQGYGQGDFHAADPLLTLECDFTLKNAAVSFNEKQQVLNAQNINATLAMRPGALFETTFTGLWHGLDLAGELALSPEKPFATKLSVQGPLAPLLQMLPRDTYYKQAVQEKFQDTTISLQTSLQAIPQSLASFTADGHIAFIDSKTEQRDVIPFESKFGLQIFPDLSLLDTSQLKFQAENLSLEKYVEPFTLQTAQTHIQGHCDVTATVSPHLVQISYCPKNLSIETPYAVISNSLDVADQSLWSQYFIDIQNHTHWGQIPLRNASYHDKNFAWHFHEIMGDVDVRDQTLSINNLSIQSNGLQAEIDLHIDLDNEMHCPTVQLNSRSVKGEIGAMQEFIAHLSPSWLWSFPTHGEIEIGQNQLQLNMQFSPTDYHCSVMAAGQIKDLTAPLFTSSIILEEAGCSFQYAYPQDTLRLSEAKATISIEQEESTRRLYTLQWPELHMDSISGQKICSFHVELSDATSVVACCKGTIAEQMDGAEAQYSLQIDSKSHFSGISLELEQCFFDGAGRIKKLVAHPKIDIKELSSFISTIAPLHWKKAFISAMLPLVQNPTVQGTLRAHIHSIDPQKHLYRIVAEASDLVIGEHFFPIMDLTSYISPNKLQVKQFILSPLETSFEVDWQQKEEIAVDHISIHIPEKIDGTGNIKYQRTQNTLQGNISHIKVYTKASNDMRKYNIAGLSFIKYLEGSGAVTVVLPNETEFSIEQNIAWNGTAQIHTKENIPFYCNVQKPIGILKELQSDVCLFENIELVDPFTTAETSSTFVAIPMVEYKINAPSIRMLPSSFAISQQSLQRMLQFLQRAKILSIDAKWTEKFFSSEGILKGSVQSFLCEKDMSMKFILDGGNYNIDEQSIALEPIGIAISSKKGMQIFTSKTWENGQKTDLSFTTADASFSRGYLVIEEAIQDENKNRQAIVLCGMQNAGQVDITQVQGELYGITCDLKRQVSSKYPASDYLALMGTLTLNPANIPVFMHRYIDSIVCHPISDLAHIQIQGEAFLARKNMGFSHIKATVQAEHCPLFYGSIDKMSAKIHYTPLHMQMRHIAVQSQESSLKIDRLILHKRNSRKWTLEIPSLFLQQFTPSYFLQAKDKNTAASPTITYAELTDFSILLDTQNTCKGKGYFHFENPQKKHWLSSFLWLPKNVIGQLGISSEILTPVKGSIHYNITEKKFELTEMRNVYSHGRRSQFYLASGYGPSYIDFAGNIQIALQVKQRSIFKFGELFTIEIQGTLKEPKYHLRAQKKRKR